MHISDIIELFLSPKDTLKFAEWAWGEEYDQIDYTHEAISKWNERHGDKLKLRSNGSVTDDVKKMIKLWKKEDHA